GIPAGFVETLDRVIQVHHVPVLPCGKRSAGCAETASLKRGIILAMHRGLSKEFSVKESTDFNCRARSRATLPSGSTSAKAPENRAVCESMQPDAAGETVRSDPHSRRLSGR